jgi:hypothetical protein
MVSIDFKYAMRVILFRTLVCFILLFLNACDHSIDIPIVQELPLFYYGCNLKTGDNFVIKNQTAFDTIFDQNVISQIPSLQNIDFSKFDVLVVSDVFTHGINKVEEKFISTNNSTYIFQVNVYYFLTDQAGNFYCGAVVHKLPSNAKVQFEIIKH